MLLDGLWNVEYAERGSAVDPSMADGTEGRTVVEPGGLREQRMTLAREVRLPQRQRAQHPVEPNRRGIAQHPSHHVQGPRLIAQLVARLDRQLPIAGIDGRAH